MFSLVLVDSSKASSPVWKSKARVMFFMLLPTWSLVFLWPMSWTSVMKLHLAGLEVSCGREGWKGEEEKVHVIGQTFKNKGSKGHNFQGRNILN